MILNDLMEAFQDYSNFEKRGIFSKRVTLDYNVDSKQPWLFFNCREKDKFSFKVHDLELGDSEAIYWHLAAQKNKEVKFEGFADMFGLGRLRGCLKVPEDYHETGIIAKKGGIAKIRTNDELFESSLKLVAGWMIYQEKTQPVRKALAK